MKTKKTKVGKTKIKGIGTSVSNVLDLPKFEKDLDVNLVINKAYCIDEEENARFKDKHFKAAVPKEIKNEDVDILVLQTGSIEITDLKVNEALVDTKKELSEYRKEWFSKVEEASTKLFNIAEDALEKNKNIKKVVILKRLPRFKRSSSDLLQIKSQLSEFGNACYDQIWQKRGGPEKIQIVEIDLKCSESKYLKDLVFGNPVSKTYDGTHLRGAGASRHFTYRAIEAITKVMFPSKPNFRFRKHRISNSPPQQPQPAADRFSRKMAAENADNGYFNTNQSSSQFAGRQQGGRTSYSDTVSGTQSYTYSVPVYNKYNPLN